MGIIAEYKRWKRQRCKYCKGAKYVVLRIGNETKKTKCEMCNGTGKAKL